MTFLVIDHVFQIFPVFFEIFYIFTLWNVVYDPPFFTRKTPISENNSFIAPFFTLFVLSRTSDNTTSQNIGGTDTWAIPPPQILGGPSPSLPLGLRPWLLYKPQARKLFDESAWKLLYKLCSWLVSFSSCSESGVGLPSPLREKYFSHLISLKMWLLRKLIQISMC